MATSTTTGLVARFRSSSVEKHRFPLALEVDVEQVDRRAIPLFPARRQRVSRRSAGSIMRSTGSSALAVSSSTKYIRVDSPIFTPRATAKSSHEGPSTHAPGVR
jgi:hypothetical protein